MTREQLIQKLSNSDEKSIRQIHDNLMWVSKRPVYIYNPTCHTNAFPDAIMLMARGAPPEIIGELMYHAFEQSVKHTLWEEA